MLDSIYVHMDITSNAVVSNGVTHEDFTKSLIHTPKNLLLLNPVFKEGEHDVHTGFKIIRKESNVTQYFSNMNRKKTDIENKWIDFTDETLLKELTPLEISELLYFGHMKTSLHSPFFYKLQNNFVFFELSSQLTRIYYRYIDEFYLILSKKLTSFVSEKINEKKNFFKRHIPIKEINIENIRQIKPILQEGVVFCFNQMELRGRDYYTPIRVVEDSLWKTQNYLYKKEPVIALLQYRSAQQTWEIIQEGPELNEYVRYA